MLQLGILTTRIDETMISEQNLPIPNPLVGMSRPAVCGESYSQTCLFLRYRLGYFFFPVSVTTSTIRCLVGDSYKHSFATGILRRGNNPRYPRGVVSFFREFLETFGDFHTEKVRSHLGKYTFPAIQFRLQRGIFPKKKSCKKTTK